LLADLLTYNIWFTLAVWSALYISDYCLTVWAAKLYKAGAGEHFVLDGSIEITPYFQEDIDALRPVSIRFLRVLAFSILTVTLAWLISVEWADIPQAFAVLIGALVFIEITAHIRHVRNIVFLRSLKHSRHLRGRIEYPRWLSLRLSSVEILGFGVLFVLAFLVSGSWFFIGGAASCLLTGLKHLDWANKAALATDPNDADTPS
jgi:hypothetical protein